MHQALRCDGRRRAAQHTHIHVNTHNTLLFFPYTGFCCLSCVLWIIEVPRDILYSLIYFQHLKPTPFSSHFKVATGSTCSCISGFSLLTQAHSSEEPTHQGRHRGVTGIININERTTTVLYELCFSFLSFLHSNILSLSPSAEMQNNCTWSVSINIESAFTTRWDRL